MVLWIQDVLKAELDVRVHSLVVGAHTAGRLVMVITVFTVKTDRSGILGIFRIFLEGLSTILVTVVLELRLIPGYIFAIVREG